MTQTEVRQAGTRTANLHKPRVLCPGCDLPTDAEHGVCRTCYYAILTLRKYPERRTLSQVARAMQKGLVQ